MSECERERELSVADLARRCRDEHGPGGHEEWCLLDDDGDPVAPERLEEFSGNH